MRGGVEGSVIVGVFDEYVVSMVAPVDDRWSSL
jgi:hypothetical protein